MGTFDGTSVIVNGEEVGVSETVAGETASAVVEGESVEVNGESVSVIFDGSTAIVNGEVVPASEEGATVVIDGEEVSVTFEGDEVIVNGEAVAEAVSAPASGVLDETVEKSLDIDSTDSDTGDNLDDLIAGYFAWVQIYNAGGI